MMIAPVICSLSSVEPDRQSGSKIKQDSEHRNGCHYIFFHQGPGKSLDGSQGYCSSKPGFQMSGVQGHHRIKLNQQN